MTALSESLANQLDKVGQQHWQSLQGLAQVETLTEKQKCNLQRAVTLSDFIARSLKQYPGMITTLLTDGLLEQTDLAYSRLLEMEFSEVQDETGLHKTLRYFRRLHMVQIAWRDLCNMQSIESSLKQVSELADSLIYQAYLWCYQHFCQRYGTPTGEHGDQHLLIIAMGKLGGKELNFSSDIDLIFAYPSPGETLGGRKPVEHQQFFTKLAQKLISALNQVTADGQVFRVDMRLRPFGESGPLVSHFAALEDYYQDQGREWERYAMIKSRIINPDSPDARELRDTLRAFTFRRYLDFGAIDSLRKMKSLISQEVRRRRLSGNIKLGTGGIREVEFIVQSFQLIRGGRETELQRPSILHNLDTLAEMEVFTAEEHAQLKRNYLYLRKLEHCLQQFDDEQTQTLPDTLRDQARLCKVMDQPDYEALLAQTDSCMTFIHSQFDELIGDDSDSQCESKSLPKSVIDLWQLPLTESEALARLNTFIEAGEAEQFWQLILSFKDGLEKHGIGQRGQDVLHTLIPLCIHKCLEQTDSTCVQALERLLQVLNAILGRTTYLQLLQENQGALSQLIRLCVASPWIAHQISRFPILLDELLNPSQLYTPLGLGEYSAELRQYMIRVEPDDLELQMELLRQFKLTQQLKTAAADVTGVLPVMKVSDHLTFLAEALIHQVIELAWQQMAAKYGEPEGKSSDNKGFAVLGYGKLGGIELGYGSDLDLVFLHDASQGTSTSGPKQVESGVFYTRLAQRIMHLFSTKTMSGQLYELDMRLRPSGNAGLLVCHINGFATYQETEAWTWEHQALVRARYIYGDTNLFNTFKTVRESLLCRQRDLTTLRTEVMEMREKMRTHLSKGNEDTFDIKQDRGGITDIEFLVQYWVLAYAHDYPALTHWSDNVRILADLATTGVIDETMRDALTECYLTMRNESHRLALQQKASLDDAGHLRPCQQQVEKVWLEVLGFPEAQGESP